MSGENVSETVDMTQKPRSPNGQKRERSSIAFPYNNLDDAIEVARAVHDNVGLGECDDDQLAIWLKLSSKSSGYRVQLSAACMFGVLDPDRSKHKLSPLGRMIVDPAQARGAKDQAFLKVPLYAAVYEKYKGGVLPSAAAFEKDIVGLGVAEKQKSRARAVFEKAAEQAGYFEHGRNRLVRPGVAQRDEAKAEGPRRGEGGSGGGDDGNGNDPPRHPLIEGLFQSLPPDGHTMTTEEAADWLQAAAYNLRFAYKFQGRIKVSVESDNSLSRGSPA
jgi:hypothetical protein